MRACELDGAWGGDQSFEVLKREGLHLMVTEVVPVGSGTSSCIARYLNKALEKVFEF